MMNPKSDLSETSRQSLLLAALHNPESELRFERIARVASRSLRAPVAQVNVLDASRQISLCSVGPGPWSGTREVPLDYSYCQHVVSSGRRLVIEDTREHPLVRDSHATTAGGVVAYAAVPLSTSDGMCFGALCVLDFTPRAWSEGEIELLEDLAEWISTEVERLEDANASRREQEDRYRTLFEQSPVGIFTYDRELRVTSLNDQMVAVLKISRADALGTDLSRIPDPEVLRCLCAGIAGERAVYEGPHVMFSTGEKVWVKFRTSPLRDGAGMVQGGMAILDDITAQKRAEQDLREAELEVLERLAQAAEFRDEDTGRHTYRVGELASRIARALGLTDAQSNLIRRAAPLHDVGKIGIPDDVLLKPGRLSVAEFEVMKTHARIGAEILAAGRSELMLLAESIARSHHERWDGTGYPEGAAGESIPLAARIVSVADFYDALSHDRVYRPAWPVAEVLEEIRRGAGSQFDPSVVEAFLRIVAAR